MNQVSVVLLTTGEDSTQDALESVHKQTVIPDDIIIVRNKSPFHKAINYGASKVKTKYFIQVDADMILDDNCIESLFELYV